MPLIAWNSGMELGLPTIDLEHRHWVEIINQLHAALMADADSISAATFVAQMQAYAAEHFPSEEQLMVAHGYPGLARHRPDRLRLHSMMSPAARRKHDPDQNIDSLRAASSIL